VAGVVDVRAVLAAAVTRRGVAHRRMVHGGVVHRGVVVAGGFLDGGVLRVVVVAVAAVGGRVHCLVGEWLVSRVAVVGGVAIGGSLRGFGWRNLLLVVRAGILVAGVVVPIHLLSPQAASR